MPPLTELSRSMRHTGRKKDLVLRDNNVTRPHGTRK